MNEPRINCDNISFLVRIIVNLIKYLHFLIPIGLIVLIFFDLFKTFTGPVDDKAKKDVFDKIIKRLIYAVVIFLIPSILIFVFKQVEDLRSKGNDGGISATSWYDCVMSIYNS